MDLPGTVFPLVLAGPLLRRVEPRSVSVWLALASPRHVFLKVWQGPQAAATSQAPLGQEGVSSSRRIGERLHLALVTKTLPEPGAPLLPDQLYSYNIELAPTPDGPREDLAALGLLQDGIRNGRPHLALGYAADQLPRFALPPQRLEDLRLFQGSCRRAHEQDVDALVFLDDFIAATRDTVDEASHRPHQLFLTGDQIYADEVATPLLPAATRVGIELIGGHSGADEEIVAHERLPALGRDYPADQTHFPTGRRQALLRSQGGLSTTGGHSHLLSLGEYCAMYLLAWSNTLWPDTLPSLAGTLDGPPSPLDDLDLLTASDAVAVEDQREHYATELRQASETQHVFDIAVGDSPSGQQLLNDLNQAAVSNALRGELSGDLGPNASIDVEIDDHQWRIADPDHLQAYFLERGLGDIRVHRWRHRLARVRRLLANCPTYMSPDDHEVTDDWNFRQEWRDRVYPTALGRTVLRNGMLAYALFQGWGSDPARFAGGPNGELLDEAERLFPAGADSGPDGGAADRIETLLGLKGGEPAVRFDFVVPGARHHVLVLDCRTRRVYPSRFAPPILLSDAALKSQIPKTPPPGVDVVFVVSSLPIVGPPVVEELIQPLSVGAYDIVYRTLKDPASEEVRLLSGTDPDMESWGFSRIGLEKVLERLEPYRQVVVLSGDVHFSSGQALSYWKDQGGPPMRLVQFTSSGLKMLLPSFIRDFFRRTSLAVRVQRLLDPVERVAWKEAEPSPVRLPPDLPVAPALRARMHRAPVLLGNHAWPAGTCTERAPDWTWRLRVLGDQRPDAERPAEVEPLPLATDVDPAGAADLDAALDEYRKVIRRHVDGITKMDFSRKALFPSNLGEVGLRPGPHYQVTAAVLAELPEAVRGALAPALDLEPRPLARFEELVDPLLQQVLSGTELAATRSALIQSAEQGSLLAQHILYAEHPDNPGHPQPFVVHTALLETPAELAPVLGDGPCPVP